MKIALYGFMGAGKSSLGKALAEKLNWNFVDLDEEIVRYAGKSINEIFADEGEIAFRKIEHQVLKEIVKRDDENIVLSLGGGSIISPANRKLLEVKNFKKIYLNVALPQLTERLKKDRKNRPLLKDIPENELDKYIEALFETRKERYETHADIDLKIDSEDFNTVLERLSQYLNLN